MFRYVLRRRGLEIFEAAFIERLSKIIFAFQNRLIFLLTALTLTGFGLLIWLSDMKYVSNFNDVLYQKTEEILDYGVVLDCGSSGTRVFVYRWHRAQSSDTNQLLDIKPLLDHYGHPVQLKVEPGLSSFG